MFTISLPLLLQVISRIDTKYSSTQLVKVFFLDRISRLFLFTQGLSLLSIIIWLYCKLPFGQFINEETFQFYKEILSNFSIYWLGIISAVLCILFCLFIYLTFIFYSPDKLIGYLINQYVNTTFDINKKKYFLALSDLLNYSLKNNPKLTRQLFDFFQETFTYYRQKNNESAQHYPPEFYETFFDANELMFSQPKKSLSYFNDDEIFDWFFEGYQDSYLSTESYKAIWTGIRQALNYNREDVIYRYWIKAHQYYSFRLRPDSIKFEGIDSESRETYRSRFLEFHYALGSYLLHMKHYKLIVKILKYSNNHPEKYYLIPENYTKLLYDYLNLNELGRDSFYYTTNYYIPDVGINYDRIFLLWIRRYFAVLLLRIYKMDQPYIYGMQNRLALPTLPSTLNELNNLGYVIESLNAEVKSLLEDDKLLRHLNLEFIKDSTLFDELKKPYPLDLLERTLKVIKDKHDEIRDRQPLSDEKINEFETKTVAILRKVFSNYVNIFQDTLTIPYQSIRIGGIKNILKKDAFVKEQEVTYLNADSILAETLAIDIGSQLSAVFALIKTQVYKVENKQLFNFIEKFTAKKKEILIVNFGIYLRYYIDILKIEGLSQESYGSIPIVTITGQHHEIVSQSLFIINRKDLPSINYHHIDSPGKEVKLIDEDFKIYTSITLPDNDSSHNQNVVAAIYLDAEIRYRSSNSCVQLKIYDQFRDKGLPDELSNISVTTE